MTRQEFLDTLRKSLNRELNASEVQENLSFYDNYFREQMSLGKSEEQVSEQLGDPRLIARTILQVDEHRGSTASETIYNEENNTVYTEDENGNYEESFHSTPRGGFHVNTFEVRPWKIILLLVLLLIIIFSILGVAIALLLKLLPLLLVAGALIWIYDRFRS